MSKRRDRHQKRMPLEEKVRLAMVDLVEEVGAVDVDAHDHEDIQGIVVMVKPTNISSLGAEDLTELLATARTLMNQLIPADHRLHQWVVTINHGDNHLGSASYWE